MTGHASFQRVFGGNSVTEFCGISQIAPWNLAKYAMEKRWPCTDRVPFVTVFDQHIMIKVT